MTLPLMKPPLKTLHMGTRVPHEVCPKCDWPGGPPKPPEPPAKDLHTFIDISLCSFTDDDIRGAAERAGVTEARIRGYLASDEQDDDLLRAVHFVSCMYPIGKFFL